MTAETPVTSTSELVDYLRAGETPADGFRIGTEHEKIGLRAEDFGPGPYQGERGIGALLEKIAREDGWTPVFEAEKVIALEKDGASITLEPGGQLELSGAPVRSIFETCDEFNRHLDLVRRVSEPMGLIWLSVGCNPLYEVADIPRMPKARYQIMRRYLPTRGDFSLHMMHLTATVQANLDFSDEADMVAKMRTAMGLTPIVSAMFANSSFSGGSRAASSPTASVSGATRTPTAADCFHSSSTRISGTPATSNGRSTFRCSSWCAMASIFRPRE